MSGMRPGHSMAFAAFADCVQRDLCGMASQRCVGAPACCWSGCAALARHSRRSVSSLACWITRRVVSNRVSRSACCSSRIPPRGAPSRRATRPTPRRCQPPGRSVLMVRTAARCARSSRCARLRTGRCSGVTICSRSRVRRCRSPCLQNRRALPRLIRRPPHSVDGASMGRRARWSWCRRCTRQTRIDGARTP